MSDEPLTDDHVLERSPMQNDDPVLAWTNAHANEVREYAGHFVAVTKLSAELRDHDADFAALYARVAEQTDVVLGRLPRDEKLTDEKLADDQAEELLKRLTKHFGKPVQPIDRYCKALETWAECMRQRASDLTKELYPGIHADYYKDPSLKPASEAAYEQFNADKKAGSRYELARKEGRNTDKHDRLIEELRSYESTSESISFVFLQIRKSCLLDRLLYCGQKLRTKKCPKHDGHWSGLEHPKNYCEHGCGFTGWIPESEDVGPYPPGVFLETTMDKTAPKGYRRRLIKDGETYAPKDGEPPLPE